MIFLDFLFPFYLIFFSGFNPETYNGNPLFKGILKPTKMNEKICYLYYCKNCKKRKEIMKNKETCLECYNKKMKYCEICKRYFIGYDDHMKLHKAKKVQELTGNLINDIWNNFVSPSSQYCKYCKKYVDETNYYFSIKKCRDCHKEYKKRKNTL